MNLFTEKKWFVYLGDHHEGPFSINDIQEKMGAGQVKMDSFVWTEGMTDWKVLREVQELASAIFGGTPTDAAVGVLTEPNNRALQANQTTQQEPSQTEAPQTSEEKTGDLSVEDLKQAQNTQSLQNPPDEPEESSKDKTGKKDQLRRSAQAKRILLLLLMGLLGVFYFQGYLDPIFKNPTFDAEIEKGKELVHPYLLDLSEKLPFLAFLESWVSPIPELENVDPMEMDELKKAARTKFSPNAPKVALALSRHDLFSPSFYLASNLPDGARFQIFILGVPQTLLNQTSFTAQDTVTINKRLGLSKNLHLADGKPVPRGEYLVLVTPADRQIPSVETSMNFFVASSTPQPSSLLSELPKDFKILISKTYFLGGKRDSVYSARLIDFHEKLRTRAANELADLKQLAITLDSQLESTYTRFAALSKNNKPRLRKDWEKFHNDWSRLQTQLHEIVQKWTPEVLQTEFFYGMLYSLVQNANQGVERVHALQHSYFTGNSSGTSPLNTSGMTENLPLIDPKTFHIQLGEAISSAHGALSLLKSKIDQAEKIPPTANGMPQKEGL